MGRAYLIVEGHGEDAAARNLLTRLWVDLQLRPIHWADPYRALSQKQLIRHCELIRNKPDADSLLILRDEDDACPKQTGPLMANTIRNLQLPFPTACVLLYREFETLFLPCLHLMAGQPLKGLGNSERPGIAAGTAFPGSDYERLRGVKEWITKQFPLGHPYKPTQDQLSLTRLIDFQPLRESQLPSFGTLERAMRFLATSPRERGSVYPPPA